MVPMDATNLAHNVSCKCVARACASSGWHLYLYIIHLLHMYHLLHRTCSPICNPLLALPSACILAAAGCLHLMAVWVAKCQQMLLLATGQRKVTHPLCLLSSQSIGQRRPALCAFAQQRKCASCVCSQGVLKCVLLPVQRTQQHQVATGCATYRAATRPGTPMMSWKT